jgi:uncharacterized protein YfaS (alpha-2-macroglobulin family)
VWYHIGHTPQLKEEGAMSHLRVLICHTELRDEKVVLFSTYLRKGTYEYTYMMRASVPGQFLVMPSVAYEMYFPEVFGRSDGGKFTVTREE